MFNNKQAYHGFNRIIIYLTYPGWCCSQNCDKCESFGDMVKSVELVVHWFPYGISASSKRFIVRTHQKWSKSPSHHGNKQKQQRQEFQVFQKSHSSARISPRDETKNWVLQLGFWSTTPSPSEWSDRSDRMIAPSHRAGWNKNMLFFWEYHISY